MIFDWFHKGYLHGWSPFWVNIFTLFDQKSIFLQVFIRYLTHSGFLRFPPQSDPFPRNQVYVNVFYVFLCFGIFTRVNCIYPVKYTIHRGKLHIYQGTYIYRVNMEYLPG